MYLLQIHRQVQRTGLNRSTATYVGSSIGLRRPSSMRTAIARFSFAMHPQPFTTLHQTVMLLGEYLRYCDDFPEILKHNLLLPLPFWIVFQADPAWWQNRRQLALR